MVKRQFADVGDFVKAGAPILEIRPTPTPKELVDAERQIELREIEVANLQAEFERQQQLFDKQLISKQEYDLIPERVVEFLGDTTKVTVLLADDATEERLIQTGLSDAIHIEVVGGLEEGERVREKPPKVIE